MKDKITKPVGFCDICNVIILSNQNWSEKRKGIKTHNECREWRLRKSLEKLDCKLRMAPPGALDDALIKAGFGKGEPEMSKEGVVKNANRIAKIR